jgi:hypothetical protein
MQEVEENWYGYIEMEDGTGALVCPIYNFIVSFLHFFIFPLALSTNSPSVSILSFPPYTYLEKGPLKEQSLSKGCHLDVVREPSTLHDPDSDAGGSLSSWQGHPSR